MSQLLKLVLFIFPFLAVAQTEVDAVLTFDGRIAVCENKMDLRNSAYRVTAPQAQLSAQYLDLSFSLQSLHCRQDSAGHYAWQEKRFTDPVTYLYPKGEGEILVEVRLTKIEFLVIKDDFTTLALNAPAQDSSRHLFQSLIPRASLLNAQEEEALSRGETVKKTLSVFARGLKTVRTSDGYEFNEGLVGGGSYNLRLKIQSNKIEITAF